MSKIDDMINMHFPLLVQGTLTHTLINTNNALSTMLGLDLTRIGAETNYD
ncbi:hypothetical protein [Pseudoalteromonas sp. MMG007]|nr:hypothetical protein [Pseudoalteromonas sp. MMG007]MBQ4859632.1 hypothetical protein [Pseudoalteromonas sp. MMG007]